MDFRRSTASCGASSSVPGRCVAITGRARVCQIVREHKVVAVEVAAEQTPDDRVLYGRELRPMSEIDRAECRRAAAECIELARATTDPATKKPC